MKQTIYAKQHDVHPRPLVSSITIEVLGGHAHIHVWNAGARSGTLVVDAQDAERMAERLLPHSLRGNEP